jgi:hypothetical protein
MTIKHCPICSAPYHPVFHQGEHGATYGLDSFARQARANMADSWNRSAHIRAWGIIRQAARLWPDDEQVAQLAAELHQVTGGRLRI